MPYVAPEEAKNKQIDSLLDIKAHNGSPPWRECVLATERCRMLIHCWPPGYSHSRHYHPRADEILYILEGQVRTVFNDGQPVVAGQGSILFAKKGTTHDIVANGDKPLLMIVFVAPNEPDDEAGPHP